MIQINHHVLVKLFLSLKILLIQKIEESQFLNLMSLPEEFDENFIILSDSNVFKVDKFQMASRMIRFKKDTSFFNSGFYRLKTKCDNSFVEKFIEAAKTGKCPDITLTNAPFYQQLSIEFEFNSLLQKCNSVILNQPDLLNLILQKLSSFDENNNNNNNQDLTLKSIETAFAFNLTQNNITKLKSLPNSFIYRILSNPQRPISQEEKFLYEFIKSKIDSGDSKAKILLSTVKYSSLNHKDLSYIMDAPNQTKEKPNQNQSQNQIQRQPPQSKPSSQISNSKSVAEKTETEKTSNQRPSSQMHKQKNMRAPDAARASSTNLQSDGFQPVYIPENSEIKQIERRVIEIINKRRSHEFPLTINREASSKMQAHYGSLEQFQEPSDVDYLILEDRFVKNIQHLQRFLILEKIENNLYDRVRTEINRAPLDDISNSNLLALTIIKTPDGFYCAILMGNAEIGQDQIDTKPPINQQKANLPLPSSNVSASQPNLSLDLTEMVKSTFYHKNQTNQTAETENIHNIFFSEAYSKQLADYLDQADRNNIKVQASQIQNQIPALKNCTIFIKIIQSKQNFNDSIKVQNKNNNSCIIALAAKQMNNGKYGCIIAYVEEDFSKEQIELTRFIKSICKEKNFDYALYKDLKQFISTPKDITPDVINDTLDPILKAEAKFKSVFITAPKFEEITDKINKKYRMKVVTSAELVVVVTKIENPQCFQAILAFKSRA